MITRISIKIRNEEIGDAVSKKKIQISKFSEEH